MNGRGAATGGGPARTSSIRMVGSLAEAGPDQGAPDRAPSKHRMRVWYLAGLVVGVLNLAVGATLPPGAAPRAVLSVLLAVAALVVFALAGRAASQAGLRPSWQAALVGLGYAVPTGLVTVLFPPTSAQLAALLRKKHATAFAIQAAQHANTAAIHWVGFVFSVVVFAGLGLILGWLGSRFARGSEAFSAV